MHTAFTPAGSGPAAAASGLGPVDGTLGSCSGIDPCSSSYDDRPPHFVAPWQFDGSQAVAVRDLVDTLEELGASVQQQRGDYVYAIWSTPGVAGSSGRLVDLEFLFAENDNTVAVRAAPQQQQPSPSSPSTSATGATTTTSSSTSTAAAANIGFLSSALLSIMGGQPGQLLEAVRIRLGWEEVPILRNRRRALFFGESPFDDFGPTPPPGLDYSKDLNLRAEGFQGSD
ncbi:hypothetical protein OEZ85_002791 [Tetradesmus obliquus]|uniref:Uncharacterized protein n=1 Tax=Tetradesmus obliquus TaxID=3088 RepID=A0ABY8TZ55_TETOB|nr:hypothetical protein OEZ85_002791 [Tetradesmus obliquus]